MSQLQEVSEELQLNMEGTEEVIKMISEVENQICKKTLGQKGADCAGCNERSPGQGVKQKQQRPSAGRIKTGSSTDEIPFCLLSYHFGIPRDF